VKKVERSVKSWARIRCAKGERPLMDVARAFGNKNIIRHLEEYEHINEFVCATFACDLTRIVEALALGSGSPVVCSLIIRLLDDSLLLCQRTLLPSGFLTPTRPIGTPSKVYKWLGSRCGTKNSLRRFAHPRPLILQGSKSPKFGLHFRPQ